MSVKEWLIKKMAISMVIPEKMIDAVVSHQFDSANDAVNVHKSVEISGFGKFYFNQKKADAHYQKLLKSKEVCEGMLEDDITETKRKSLMLKLQIVNSSIKSLKPKIDHEPGTNL